MSIKPSPIISRKLEKDLNCLSDFDDIKVDIYPRGNFDFEDIRDLIFGLLEK